MSAKTRVEVDGTRLTLSNLDKVLYPGHGFTKGEVIDYYARIAPALLPHLPGPPGHAQAVSRRRRRADVLREERALPHARLGADRRASHSGRQPGVARLRHRRRPAHPRLAANLAALELHVPAVACRAAWRRARPRPDGLRPRPRPARRSGRRTRGRRAAAGAARPRRAASRSPRRAAARACTCTCRSRRPPTNAPPRTPRRPHSGSRRTTAISSSAAWTRRLRRGKVFVDWSQNNRHKTTVAPYSLRAAGEPCVSTPVTWDEIESGAALRIRPR